MSVVALVICISIVVAGGIGGWLLDRHERSTR
jgi:hypothetical protein